MRGAAMAAGGAAVYHAGKKHQAGKDQQAAQDAQDAQPQQQAEPAAAPAPAEPAATGLTQDSMDELEHLGMLHTDGVLTDEEFAAAKAKILGT
jgi:hypothetical protein